MRCGAKFRCNKATDWSFRFAWSISSRPYGNMEQASFKKPFKQFRDDFGHTPLSVEERIPWKCRQLVIGTGADGKLPVMDQVRREAERRKVKLVVLPTLKRSNC